MSCFICDRIESIKQNENPYFVMELDTGYVVLGDHQRIYGYTLFLCKEHVRELHELNNSFMMRYLEEMAMVAKAVQGAFPCDKMNYELLGNGDSHVHWHLFPRREHDIPMKGPVWFLPMEELYHDKYLPKVEQLEEMKATLRKEIQFVQSEWGM